MRLPISIYPYKNIEDFNLDYLQKKVDELKTILENFISLNAIKYADPIQWNISKQYETNTVVIDANDGTAYLSVQPVPSGVALSNTDYWTPIFNLGQFITKIARNFTNRYEEESTTTATFNSNAGDWIVWGDVLYNATVNINIGDAYVVGGNIEHFTMEYIINTALGYIGNLGSLKTANRDNLVNAINEVIVNLAGNFAFKYEEITNDTATFASNAGDWLVWGSTLYNVTSNIAVGDSYVIGGNIEHFTIEEFIPQYFHDELLAGLDAALNDVEIAGDLTYKTPVNIPTLHNGLVGYVPFKDGNGNDFKLLTSNSANHLPADPHINVKEFGAVGDGTTDDTTSILAAFSAAGNDTAVYFPSGHYKVSGTINVNTKYVFGDGECSHITYYGNDKLFVMSAGSTIANLFLDADNNTSSIGIFALDKNFVTIDSVYLNNFYDCIVFDGTCFYCTCTRLKGFHWKHAYIKTQDTAGTSTGGHQIAFENITFASGEGDYVFYLDNIGSFNFSDVLCSPNLLTTASIYWGTMAPLAGLTWLVNTGFESAPKAMKFDANFEHYYFYFANCYFGAPFDMVKCRQMSFTNCYFTGDAIGCRLYLTQEISFIGCHFLNGLHSGIELLGSNFDTSLLSCSNPNTGTYPFVTRADKTLGIKIIGCTIKTPNIESIGDLTNVILSANNIANPYTEVITTQSAPIVISTNLGSAYNARSYGIIPLNANAINAQFDCTLAADNQLVCYPHGTYDSTSDVKILAYAQL